MNDKIRVKQLEWLERDNQVKVLFTTKLQEHFLRRDLDRRGLIKQCYNTYLMEDVWVTALDMSISY